MINKISNIFNYKIRNNSNLNELFQGSKNALILKIFGMSLNYLMIMLISKLYGIGAWGSFALLLVLIQIGTIFSILGTDIVLLKNIAIFNKREDRRNIIQIILRVLIIVIITNLITILIFFMNVNNIQKIFFHRNDLSELIKLAILSIPFTAFVQLISQVLRGFKSISKHVFIEFISKYLFMISFIIIFYNIEKNNYDIIYSYLLALFITIIIGISWIYKNINLIGNKNNSKLKNKYKDILKSSIPLFLAGSMIFIKTWIDSIMLGMYRTEYEVGIYSLVVRLAGLVSLPLMAINTIAAPKFAEYYAAKKYADFERTIRYTSKMMFFSATPILISLLIFGKFLMKLFSDEYVVGFSALVIICFGQLINVMSGSVGYIMQMTGEEKTFQLITTFTVIIGVILNYYLIPTHGIEGAALATAITTMIWNISLVLYIKWKFKILTIYIFN